MNDFVIHACEQSLRFSTVNSWESLSDKLRTQLSFNVGVMALGLNLSKEEGYQALADLCLGKLSMSEFHQHVRSLVESREIKISEENISRVF